LSQQFASHGLQFFKVNKTVTHVSVARPQFLDLETTPVSENIKRIVEFINAHPKCTRRKLIEALAPTPQPTVIEVKPEEQKSAEPTPEQNAIIADLHWLVHQGHVIGICRRPAGHRQETRAPAAQTGGLHRADAHPAPRHSRSCSPDATSSAAPRPAPARPPRSPCPFSRSSASTRPARARSSSNRRANSPRRWKPPSAITRASPI
jgi:hypothetical protein